MVLPSVMSGTEGHIACADARISRLTYITGLAARCVDQMIGAAWKMGIGPFTGAMMIA